MNAEENDEPIPAYEVPQARRTAQVVVAVIYCLFAAGIVFGYAAIKPVLISEGVYRDQCTDQERKDAVEVCAGQELRLNLMFTVAAVSTNVCALIVGIILDQYGPRLSSVLGCILISAGCVSLAFAEDLPFDAYIPGYLFLALGGPFIFIPSFHLSNTFPNYSGLILALLTGAFDTSSAQFLFYRLEYSWSDHSFTLRNYFTLYLAVPAFIFIVQFTLMPARSYHTVGELLTQAELSTTAAESDHRPGPSSTSETTPLLDSKAASTHLAKESARKSASGVWGALHSATAWQQIRTPWFILITLFTVVQMTRINYFVATVRPQYAFLLGDADAARQVNHFFDIALPLGGVLAVPFIGALLDNCSTQFVLGALVVLASAIGVLGLVPGRLWAAYANISLFVLYRPFYYTAVSDYAAKVFGFHTFGKVYGLIITLAGLGNLSQTGLDAVTVRVFGGDPRVVNAGLLGVAGCVGVVLWGYVFWRGRWIRRELLEEEAWRSVGRERVMPGGEVP